MLYLCCSSFMYVLLCCCTAVLFMLTIYYSPPYSLFKLLDNGSNVVIITFILHPLFSSSFLVLFFGIYLVLATEIFDIQILIQKSSCSLLCSIVCMCMYVCVFLYCIIIHYHTSHTHTHTLYTSTLLAKNVYFSCILLHICL